jgi:transcriptional regulator with XRE-family HTH domain
MSEMSSLPLPVIRALRQLGHDLALARRRRGISTVDMAERLFISRRTLWRLENGDPTVSLGAFASATFVLQIHDRLAQLAAPAQDTLAFELDEERLPKRIRRKKNA